MFMRSRNHNFNFCCIRHVGLIILHHDPLHAPDNVRVYIPNSTNPIYDNDIQCLRVPDYNHYELWFRFRSLLVWDVLGPSVRVLNVYEWAIGNDAALYTDIISIVLWTSLFIIVRASDQPSRTPSPTGLLVDRPGSGNQGHRETGACWIEKCRI